MPDDNRALERITFQPGETIFNEGDDGQSAYIIESGMVEIAREVGGKKVPLGTIDKNGIFGEMALVDDTPRMASATALTDCVLVAASEKSFQDKLDRSDPFVGALLRIFARNIRSLTK